MKRLTLERAGCASTSSGAPTTPFTSSRSGGCRWRATIPGAEVLNWKDLSPRLGVVLRPVRNRQDGGQVLAEPLRPPGGQGQHQQRPPGHRRHQQRQPHLDRSQRRLHRAGRSAEPAAERRARPVAEQQLRQAEHDAAASIRTGRPASARGRSTGRCCVTLQHELLPRVGVEVSYNRRAYGNFIVNDNTLARAGRLRPVLHHRAAWTRVCLAAAASRSAGCST